MMIGLPASSLSNGQYCFNVMGDNGTYAAVLEGTFNPADKIAIQGDTILFLISCKIVNDFNTINRLP